MRMPASPPPSLYAGLKEGYIIIDSSPPFFFSLWLFCFSNTYVDQEDINSTPPLFRETANE